MCVGNYVHIHALLLEILIMMWVNYLVKHIYYIVLREGSGERDEGLKRKEGNFQC